MERSPASSNTTLVATAADIETGIPTTSAQRFNSTMSSRLFNGQAMPQMQTVLSPQQVGREFVRQYYTLMSKSPQLLYRFYAANSTLTFGNGPTIVGQNKIRKDIEKRGLNNCHTRIFKIDAQPTLGNGLVVQVIGELSNNNEPLRPFTQTFVLTPLVPKNFFVHNEIFRFQDDLQPDLSLESHSITTVPNCVGASTELWIPPRTVRTFSPVLTQQVIAISKSIASIAIQTPNESALLFEESAASPLSLVLKPEAIKQTTGKVAETENVSDILPNLRQETQKPLTSNSNLKMPESNAAMNPTKVQKSDLLLESKNANSQTDINSTPKSHSPTQHLSKSSATVTLVNPSLTYANVFKSSSGQFLKEPKDLSTDCDLNVEISTSYIPSATFTTSTSPNMSPAPNGNSIITPLVTSRLISPIPDVKQHSNNGLTTESNIPTIKSNNNKLTESSTPLIANTTTKITTTQTSFRRNRNEGNGNRFESGIGRNQRNTANSGISSTSYQTQRRPRPQYERYDDNLQLFLGNLPLTATVEDLKHIFERYGTILELRVLSKSSQQGQRKLPNYGFLTFASTESVERCLNDLPLYFPENSSTGVRLNVRPKNETTNTTQQQQQSARSGKSNMRYDNGGDHIRNSDQNRNYRFIKRGVQEAQNGSGEAPNELSSPRTSPIATVPLKDEWPELGAAGNGGNTHRKGSKK